MMMGLYTLPKIFFILLCLAVLAEALRHNNALQQASH